jgi:hypothetical protein
MDGRLLRDQVIENQQIDLSDLPKGLLFFQLLHRGALRAGRIVKQGL